jgi:hypothetical protein
MLPCNQENQPAMRQLHTMHDNPSSNSHHWNFISLEKHLSEIIVKFFLKLFFTQDGMPHILRFDFSYTVIIPTAPQETVEEAGIKHGTAALQSGSPSHALA